ncbi:putative flavoprotein involved in K+ transport [Micromonospora rhizosphaerae]|uniref:Putative flavoprotein involved in K+ transport n=1 Tax=Micromonospora rhizosphaerae TaxID=568872 RepID=A0A1C6SE62_9ACTN|nr:NAD(P)/FAD-dependent oxidoreductase [Micromonospora rhizosphaerae]SCL27766.1 putative flavoprotein involved in K+ transport [Micromonospora rhizosphaerae]
MDLDTVIVGGGQAGLALGHYLRRAGVRFAILDAHNRVGDSWRQRWDSLTLFTPRRFDGLPGLPFPGDPDGHPSKDEVADYLARYAAHFDLPVRLGCGVTSVRPGTAGGFTVDTSTGTLRARRVVVAAGAFHTPRIPEVARKLAPRVTQLHSSRYRNPDRLPGRDVLVVGGGNTGVQIAGELADHGRRVALAAPTIGPALPQRWLGRDIFWWFSRLGTMRLSAESRLGRRIAAQNPVIGTDVDRLLRRVDRVGRVVDAEGCQVLLADGGRRRVDTVVWATGFRPHYPWLEVPVLDASGAPVHREGVTDWPGLYLLGLPWQRTRGSAVLGWVGRDAQVLAARLADDRRLAPARPAPAVPA